LPKQVASGSGWSRIIHVKDEEENPRESTWIETAEDPPGCRSLLPSPTSSRWSTSGAGRHGRDSSNWSGSNIRFDLKSLTGSNAAGNTLTSGFSAR
jgi:hypothetical protein